jgi:hypothetical protein
VKERVVSVSARMSFLADSHNVAMQHATTRKDMIAILVDMVCVDGRNESQDTSLHRCNAVQVADGTEQPDHGTIVAEDISAGCAGLDGN